MKNHSSQPTLQQTMLSRRQFLQGAAIGLAATSIPASLSAASTNAKNQSLNFTEIAKNNDVTYHLAKNYSAKSLLSWGDNIINNDIIGDNSKSFDASALTATTQAKSFGFNNDFIAFMSLPQGSNSSNHGLLCVNHEYTNSELMFSTARLDTIKIAEKNAIEMNAHGCSVVEVKYISKQWHIIHNSRYNRRITASTPMNIAGLAAGDAQMRTTLSPDGKTAQGTIGNCSGGTTPWGTVLTAEENFDAYFAGSPKPENKRSYQRYGIAKKSPAINHYQWHKTDSRFDLGVEPNEPNHFGWLVEYNPYDPLSTPIKRTSIGRFKHECAKLHVNYDGKIVVYSGDDEMFEYLYRYVSNGKYIAGDATNNNKLLDDGVLSVAQFHADGTLKWLPLIYGKGGLNEANGFASQADVLINTRKAGDVLGATPMDRPEDIEIHPFTGAVYVSLTMNIEREHTNPANPRLHNKMGHILQLNPKQISLANKNISDHTANIFTWQPFLLAGNPDDATHGAKYQNQPSKHGWLANPDNLSIDGAGNLWVATDGQQKTIGFNEGLYAMKTVGAQTGKPKCFLTAPIGAEVTGPCFTPDFKTLFVSIQHPAEGLHPDGKTKSTYDNPSTRFPDFNLTTPPRPTILAITHINGKIIGD